MFYREEKIAIKRAKDIANELINVIPSNQTQLLKKIRKIKYNLMISNRQKIKRIENLVDDFVHPATEIEWEIRMLSIIWEQSFEETEQDLNNLIFDPNDECDKWFFED